MEALEEVVADSMETMFNDGAVIERLARENPTLWERIKNFLREMLDSIRAAYAGVDADSVEGRIVAGWTDQLAELETRFANALTAAGKGYAKAGEGTASESGVSFNIRQTKKMSYKEQIRQAEARKLNGSNALYLGVTSANLRNAGFSDAPFAMNQSDYRKARRKAGNNKNYSSHSVPIQFFMQAPTRFNDSVMFFDNGNKVTIITDYEMNDSKGNPSYIIAGVWLNQQMSGDTVNQVKSVYPLDDFVQQVTQAADNGKLVVTNKNKAEQMLATIGVQPAEVSSILDLAKKSIAQTTDKSQDKTKSFSTRERNEEYLVAVKRGDSDRAALADALMDAAKNEGEREVVRKYREKVGKLNEQEARLREINAEIKELSFAKGKRDTGIFFIFILFFPFGA